VAGQRRSWKKRAIPIRFLRRIVVYASDGRGTCSMLKDGSDITSDPPVFVLDGENGYMLRILTDASRCKNFEKMEFIDHDGTECSDPMYRRSMRQLQDK
jgi:hypothetical protein